MNATTPLEAPTPIRLTVRDLEVLDQAGALLAHPHTELFDGVIVAMSPMGSRHAATNTRLLIALHGAAARHGSLVASLGPTVAIPPHDAPQPDLVVTPPLAGESGYLPASSVLIAIEIADTTLRHDLTAKRDLYARGGIPEYWVVDVAGGRLHQFWAPADGRYAEERVVPVEGPLASATIPALTLDGTGIL